MLLSVLFLLGTVFARKVLGLSRWAEALPVGLAMTQVFLLLATNATLRLWGWSAWPLSLGLFWGALVLLLWRKRLDGPVDAGPVPPAELLLAAASFLYAGLLQSEVLDDD